MEASVRFRDIDLNLLVALERLLVTRSVTAAAREIHVTQPAMSGSLARLREHFGDPLLVPSGRGMVLSPFAETLLGPVCTLLASVRETAAMRPHFDPAVSEHRFRISGSDHVLLVLLIPVMEAVQRQAPHVAFELLPTDASHALERLQHRDLDFAFVPERFVLPAHPHKLVLSDRYVCVAWSGNEQLQDGLTLERYLALPHVTARYGYEKRAGAEQWATEQLGIVRREAASCSSPNLMAPLVVGTDRIATVPARLARYQARFLPIRVFEPPVQGLPPLNIHLQWHASRDADSAIGWFQGLFDSPGP